MQITYDGAINEGGSVVLDMLKSLRDIGPCVIRLRYLYNQSTHLRTATESDGYIKAIDLDQFDGVGGILFQPMREGHGGPGEDDIGSPQWVSIDDIGGIHIY